MIENIKAGYTAAFWRDSDTGRIQTNSGIIDDDGSLYMSGLPLGAITVGWGEASDQIVISVTSLRTTN
ncbi:hypothetical protein ACNKHT_06300 [Shigella flexneri]